MPPAYDPDLSTPRTSTEPMATGLVKPIRRWRTPGSRPSPKLTAAISGFVRAVQTTEAGPFLACSAEIGVVEPLCH